MGSSGPSPRLASTIADVAGRRTSSYRCSASSVSPGYDNRQPVSVLASRIACDAPLEPIGYIG